MCLYGPVNERHICDFGIYISAVNLKAESQTLLGDSWYAPLILSPSTGVKLTFNPA
jgi:hypothetical protein